MLNTYHDTGFRLLKPRGAAFCSSLQGHSRAERSWLSGIIVRTLRSALRLVSECKPNKLSDLQMFDEASRGPLGSLKLLVARRKNSLLASCAAGVMLASLFVDPFIQLAFTFQS